MTDKKIIDWKWIELKKILSAFLAFAIIISTNVCFAAIKNESDVMVLLNEFKIMTGDPDGNLRLNDYVTRAEFTKVAIASSSYKNSVSTALKISPFSDVTYKHWSAPYVKVAVTNKICEGYTDSTFKPDNNVKLEEAVTMLLKVLGYTNEDFGLSWPYGQMGLANNLEITKNVDAKIGDFLTRGQVATLVFNTLDTKMKNSSAKLISIFDCNLYENVTLIATKNENGGMASGKIYTSGGLFDLNKDFDYNNVGRKGDLYVKNGDDIIAFIPEDQIVEAYTVTDKMGSDMILDGNFLDIDDTLTTYYKSSSMTYSSVVPSAKEGDELRIYYNDSKVMQYALLIPKNAGNLTPSQQVEKYVVYQMLDKSLVVYKDNQRMNLEIEDTTDIYEKDIKYSYQNFKAKLAMGDILNVKRDSSGEIDYISYEKGNIKGPKTVKNSEWLAEMTSDTSGITITRDGINVSMSDIKINDIVYYIAEADTILAYSTKITGIYEKAAPNKDTPTSITVSGVSYEVESAHAFDKLSSTGSFSYGDTITVLLGKDNRVADVISPEEAAESGEIVGYVTGYGTKQLTKPDTTTYTGYYIRLALPDGNEYEYVAYKNYESLYNSIVKLTFTDGVAKASSVTGYSGEKGTLDWGDKTIGKYKISPNIKIIDVGTTEETKKSAYVSVFPQRIDGILLDGKILYMNKTDKNEITELILDGVTGDFYTYALVTKVTKKEKSSITSSFSYDINGNSFTYGGSTSFSGLSSGIPVAILYSASGAVDYAKPLTKVSSTVTSLTQTTLKAGETEYSISDKAVFYKRDSNYDYTLTNIADINTKDYSINAYYDKSDSNGGKIRIIVAIEK